MKLEFKIATALEDLDAYYHLRWKVYGDPEVGMINPDEFLDQREKDIYDPYSKVILCKDHDQEQIVAGSRIVTDNPYGFPLENCFTIDHLGMERAKIGEISRRVTLNHHHAKFELQKISVGVVAQTILQFKEMGLTHYICALPPEGTSLHKRMGGEIMETPHTYSIGNKQFETYLAYLEIDRLSDRARKSFNKVINFD